jgi:RNA methyltransferase, TrmH family
MEPLSKARIRQLRALKLRKHRDEQGLFVGEGPLLIEESLRGGVPPRYLAVCEELLGASQDKADSIIATCRERGVECFRTDMGEFMNLSDTVNSQGMLAVYAMPSHTLETVLAGNGLTLLVLDNLRDPGNMGTILRQAAAFDCSGLLLLKGCVDAYNHKSVRASMGGVFHVPVVADLSPQECMAGLAQAGVWPYVTAARGANAFAVTYPPRTAFIIGGETEGVQPFWHEQDVIQVSIPQTEKVESLNAAVAASILLAFRYQG